jgi:hypothetical protein
MDVLHDTQVSNIPDIGQLLTPVFRRFAGASIVSSRAERMFMLEQFLI